MSSQNGIHTIQEFYTNLQKSGRLLSYQFGITITKSGMEDIHLYGQSTSIPERTINDTEISYYGQTFKIPTTISEGNNEWSIDMTTDADNAIYNRMREWQEQYASWANSGGGYKGISTINAFIDLYNAKMNKIVDTFCLKGIWPSKVGEIKLDHSAGGDALATFSIDLVYILMYNSKRSTDPLR